MRRILNTDRYVDAPLVQTYINNIAIKCGLKTDTIFDAGQEFENLCIYYPLNGYMYFNDYPLGSPSQAFHYDNRWMVTLAELLDKLKVVFCAEWYVTPNNTIQFKYIKDLIVLDPIYDYTATGAEPIYNLHYSFNGTKKAAYGRYEYATDGSDLASQEVSSLYNDIVDYDGPAINPMLEGDKSKMFDFASTGFVRDGREPDYLRHTIDDADIGFYIIFALCFVITLYLLGGIPFTTGAIIVGAAIILVWTAIHVQQISDILDEFVRAPIYTG